MSAPSTAALAAQAAMQLKQEAEILRIDQALEQRARKGGPPSALAARYHAYLATLGRRRQALCREMLLMDAAAYRLMRLEAERQQDAAEAAAAPAAESGA